MKCKSFFLKKYTRLLSATILLRTILPIALYACEVWGFENIQLTENLKNEFLRHITNSKKSTPIYMLYAELGHKPIAISIKNRMIGYWLNIINSKNSKLSNLLYNILLHEYNARIFQHKWGFTV